MKELKQIQINKSVWQKAKLYCVQNNITLKEFIEKLIENGTQTMP